MLRRRFRKSVERQTDVPVDRGVVAEIIGDARPEPLRRVGRKAEIVRDGVGAVESDRIELLAQNVRVLSDHADRAVPPFFVNVRDRRRADIVLAEDHQFADPRLLAEGFADLRRLFARDAGNVGKPFGMLFDHVEGVVPEPIDDLQCGHGTDPVHVPAREVFQDLVRPGRHDLFDRRDRELLAVFGVIGPVPVEFDAFSLADVRHLSDRRDQFPLVGGKIDHGIVVLLVLKDDPLDGPDKFTGSPVNAGSGRRRFFLHRNHPSFRQFLQGAKRGGGISPPPRRPARSFPPAGRSPRTVLSKRE